MGTLQRKKTQLLGPEYSVEVCVCVCVCLCVSYKENLVSRFHKQY